MDWMAFVLIAVGIALVVMGWTGSYANVWQFMSGTQQSPPGNTSPPAPGQQQGPPQFGLQQQQQGNYNLSLGNHLG